MLEHEKRLSYEDAFNPMMRDYQAGIEIEPASHGDTSIHWHGAHSSRWGLGWLMRPYLLLIRGRSGPPDWGERVHAIVVPRPGATVTLD